MAVKQVVHEVLFMSKDNSSKSNHINIGGEGHVNIQGTTVGGQNNQATYISNNSGRGDNIDTETLSKELSVLLEALRKEATNTEHFISMGDVANAQKLVEQGNMTKAYEYLVKGGKWVLDIAQKSGTQVVVKIIQTAIGLE
jgi:hypothetical protein